MVSVGAIIAASCKPEINSGLETSSSVSTTSLPSEAPTVIKTKTLRYWTWASSTDDNPRAQAQGTILQAFRDSHPNIEVVEEVIPWNELRQQVLQSAAAGTSPDVSRQIDQYVGTLADAGAILPLDEYISTWSDDRLADFLYDWNDTTFNESKFAFRQSVRPTNILYYRTDIFSKAPQTWNDFNDEIITATSDQMYGWLLPFSKADSLNYFMQHVPPMLWSLGSDLIDPKTSNPIFNNEVGVKVIKWLQDLVNVHEVMPQGVSTMDAEAVNQQFLGGTAASVFSNTAKWGQWSQREEIIGKVATTPFPNFANDSAKPGPVNLAGAWTLTMGKDAQKEEAWELMEFMQSNEAELIDAKIGGEIPTRKSTLTNEWFQTDEAKRIKSYLDWMDMSPHQATTLSIKNVEGFTDVLGDALQRIIVENADVKTELDNAAEKYQSLIS